MRLTVRFFIGLLLSLYVNPLKAGDDVFLQAAGFALTGSDDARVKPVDRKSCVFQIDNDVYFLNNVQTDRIRFSRWRDRLRGTYHWTVSLHGSETVLRKNSKANLANFNAEQTTALLQIDPYAFADHISTHNETDLSLGTDDIERVKRAWTFIYSHGCSGQKSPF